MLSMVVIIDPIPGMLPPQLTELRNGSANEDFAYPIPPARPPKITNKMNVKNPNYN